MKVLGIFRGFPGLGRVVAGVSLLETLRDNHHCEIKIITYLQGEQYVLSHGANIEYRTNREDYCAIGILPTSKFGHFIHHTIRTFQPDIVILDGEPLLVQSLRISFPNLKTVVLLNPADVNNPSNDVEAMDYFNELYSNADLAIVHGLNKVKTEYPYSKIISIGTIIRCEIFDIKYNPSNKIYCILGGGTVNVGQQFSQDTIQIARLCVDAAALLPEFEMHIICSSMNIYNAIRDFHISSNTFIYNSIINATHIYSDAQLIITRSGRNSLSEVLFLGIPTITFVTGDTFRRAEQEQNLMNIKSKHIKVIPMDTTAVSFSSIIQAHVLLKRAHCHFECGNNTAIKHILSLV